MEKVALQEHQAFHVIDVTPKISGIRVGKVVEVHEGESVVVDYSGNRFGPLKAQIAGSLSIDTLKESLDSDISILLTFEDDDPRQPIVLDTVKSVPESNIDDVLKEIISDSNELIDKGNEKNKALPRVFSESTNIITRIACVRNGKVFIYPESHKKELIEARTTIQLRNLTDDVLVVFSKDQIPIIVGQVYPSVQIEKPCESDSDVVLKGRNVRIEASSALILMSRHSKLEIDGRGKITTTSDQIVSRARVANKVQGGCIQLN